MMGGMNRGQTKMLFSKVFKDTKKETEDLGALWQSMMSNAHLPIKNYVIDKGQILHVLNDGAKAGELVKFLKLQPEFKYMDQDGVKHWGPKGPQQDILDEEAEKKRKNDELIKKQKAEAEKKKKKDKKKKKKGKKKKKNKKGKSGSADSKKEEL